MKKWYILHVLSGKEHEVMENIKIKLINKEISSLFGEILVPVEELIEIKFGKKERSKKKFFPGYILIEMIMTYQTWFLVRYTEKVIGFVGGTCGIPVPVCNKEVELIISRIKESSDKPKPKKSFNIGEIVRVIDGPFSDFSGKVEEINYSKNKLCVGVLIFGRSTPIDLNFNQVEKV
jgi:transcriptional antiterminator NusG